jgi:chromosome segregation protein
MAEAVTALDARVAELRHVEAELETVRQAHYAAADKLHVAQGDLASAALEVSRLEERIRYVVEGRQRVEQRLVDLRAQNAQWAQRQDEAKAELASIAEQIAAAQEQGEVLVAQAEEQGAQLPTLEDAVRSAQGRSNEQRSLVAQVQQQIQVLAAESRSVEEQARQLNARHERMAAERQTLAAPDLSRLDELKRQTAAADEAKDVAEVRLHELSEQVPGLDEQRRAQQEGANVEAGRQADLNARLQALRALQEKVQTEGKLKPWLARHGLDGLAGPWTKAHIEPGWGTAP